MPCRSVTSLRQSRILRLRPFTAFPSRSIPHSRGSGGAPPGFLNVDLRSGFAALKSIFIRGPKGTKRGHSSGGAKGDQKGPKGAIRGTKRGQRDQKGPEGPKGAIRQNGGKI